MSLLLLLAPDIDMSLSMFDHFDQVENDEAQPEGDWFPA